MYHKNYSKRSFIFGIILSFFCIANAHAQEIPNLRVLHLGNNTVSLSWNDLNYENSYKLVRDIRGRVTVFEFNKTPGPNQISYTEGATISYFDNSIPAIPHDLPVTYFLIAETPSASVSSSKIDLVLDASDSDWNGTSDLIDTAIRLGMTDTGFDPSDATSTLDTDGDGYYDWQEIINGSNPYMDESTYNALGPILYVDAKFGSNSNNGRSAFAQGGTSGAMANIETALNSLNQTTVATIVVLSGTYNEGNFNLNGKTIRLIPIGDVRVKPKPLIL